jgi:hypothetical protein
MLSYVDNFLLDRAPLAPRFAILLTRLAFYASL